MNSLEQAIARLRNDVLVILEELRPVIESAARFSGFHRQWGLIPHTEAMLCRQYECLECILHLVQQQHLARGFP
jgi:hypothetical protein